MTIGWRAGAAHSFARFASTYQSMGPKTRVTVTPADLDTAIDTWNGAVKKVRKNSERKAFASIGLVVLLAYGGPSIPIAIGIPALLTAMAVYSWQSLKHERAGASFVKRPPGGAAELDPENPAFNSGNKPVYYAALRMKRLQPTRAVSTRKPSAAAPADDIC